MGRQEGRWQEDGLRQSSGRLGGLWNFKKVRKISLCKPCYRTWKKEKKGEPKEWE